MPKIVGKADYKDHRLNRNITGNARETWQRGVGPLRHEPWLTELFCSVWKTLTRTVGRTPKPYVSIRGVSVAGDA